MRQVVKIKDLFYVDRCVNFGSSASPMIWCAYFLLVLWIAWSELGLEEFSSFMDDTWGLSLATDIISFKDRSIPLNQAKFLALFDFLKIPWNWDKQVWGVELEVIGHWIDCNKMIISLEDVKQLALAQELNSFASELSHPLVQWSRMTGWANWGLNCFPLGRWALQSSWDKMAGKTLRNALVPSNSTSRADLKWLAAAFSSWDGRQLLDSFSWKLDEANITFFCDACPTGIGLWIPKENIGYTFSLPPPSRDIYWAELTAVVSCIMISKERSAHKVVVFTDSENVVDLFSSHRAIDTVRQMFKTAVDLMLNFKMDIKVKHVPGERNVIADNLSRNNLSLARSNVPTLQIETLPHLPPHIDGGQKKHQIKLGTTKKFK